MNAKKKGNKGENDFATWLRSKGIRAYKDGASGGAQHKGDLINNLDLTIEVKTVKRINLMDAWRQVDRDASAAHNSPILAIHFDGMPKNEWLIVQHSEDWADGVVEGPKSNSDTIFSDSSIKWDVQRMIEASKKVMKHFD